MSKRSYSDEQKANALLVLDANGGNVLRTSRETGIPPPTLSLWRNHRATRQAQPWVADICEGNRKPLADRLEEVARLLVEAIPEKIAAASLRDCALAAAITTDKMRLLREQPTSINREQVSDEERISDVVAVLDAARERAARGPLPGASVN